MLNIIHLLRCINNLLVCFEEVFFEGGGAATIAATAAWVVLGEVVLHPLILQTLPQMRSHELHRVTFRVGAACPSFVKLAHGVAFGVLAKVLDLRHLVLD